MNRVLPTLFTLVALGVLVYTFRAPIENRFGGLLATIQSVYAPCRKPIAYSLGTFDTRFGISKEDFLGAVKEAEAIWEKPIEKELFAYSSGGPLKISLVYDYRQEATSKLKNLGLAVDASRASYDALQAKYEEVKSVLSNAQAQYEAGVATYQSHLDEYNKNVQYWNGRGGAPKSEFARLEGGRTSLNSELADVRALQERVNGYVDEVNALMVVLNGIASSLNVDVGKYNTVGASRGEEFTEGVYESSASEQKIDIYEFSTHNKLVRVLAHELGHALGLDHVAGEQSIMYKLNQSTNEKLSSQDLSELKTKCGIE